MHNKIDKSNVEDLFLLSSIQQGILFHYISEPDNLQYVEQLSLSLTGELQEGIIKETWKHLAMNNELLRTVFRWKGLDKPVQIVLKQYEVPFDVIDLSSKEEGKREDLLKEIRETIRRKRIDISQEPFLITLVKLQDSQWEMIITNHHILYDGWSTGILLKEFFKTYEMLSKGLQPKGIKKNKYKEFIKWCNERNKADEKQYWENYLESFDTITSFAKQSYSQVIDQDNNESKKITRRLPEALVEEIKTFCKDSHITMATLLYSGWGILLSKYSNSKDVVFGTTISGRPPQINGIEDMMGLFINTLPLRIKNDGSETVAAVLHKVDGMLKERTAYENTPLVDIQQYSSVPNKQLFDSIMVIENYPIDQLLKEMEGSIKVNDFTMVEETNYNLAFSISVFDGIDLNIGYRGHDDNWMMGNLLNHYENIITTMVTNPNSNINQINLLTKEEEKRLLQTFNDTKVEYSREKTLHQLFEEQVETVPNNIAVVGEKGRLTYGELNEKANQLARVLRAKGVKKDTIVGLMVDRTVEMMIGILAVLKAGGAYLPIDPQYPEDRIQFMLEDSGSNILLTQSWLQKAELFEGEVLFLDQEKNDHGEKGNLDLSYSSGDLAYIIYTSGSTGKPKGVAVEHKSLNNFINTFYHKFDKKVDGNDRCLSLTNIAFDVSVAEIFLPITYGATLVLFKTDGIFDVNQLAKTIIEESITFTYIPPSLLKEVGERLLQVKDEIKLDKMLVGVEPIKDYTMELFLQLNPHMKIINGYGPTEATICTTMYEYGVEEAKGRTIPIGKPLFNTEIYIVDSNNNLQPIGVAGELCIAGDGLARGYLNRIELTAEKFVDNPFRSGERMYRTGDLAKWLPDGNIEFVGRVDHQVKIRGYRIELGEVESQLSKYAGIKDAVVLAKEDSLGVKYLCGYIVAKEEIDIPELKREMGKALPSYMIPSHIMQLEKMPLTSNGKVNRKALPEPHGTIGAGSEYEAPRNKTEEILVGIWKEILGVTQVGINDNFFELGGHSLKTTAMVAKIHKLLNVEVPLKEIFNTPTIKGIATYIKNSEESIYAAIKAVEEKEYYPTSAAQKRLYSLQQFDKKSIGYNIPGAIMLEGQLDHGKIESTFKKLIERHESLRTSFDLIGEEPVQYIHREVAFNLKYMEATEGDLKKILKDFVKAFDLKKAPLMRVGLVKILPLQHLLIFDMHHIISDGISMGVLIREFTDLYRGESLEELKIQYKDYSVWQKELMTSGKIEEQKQYWLKQFEGEIPVLNLMGDYPRPALQSYEGQQLSFKLEEELTSNLRKICKETGTTMYMVLLSAYNILLSKYSRQEEIIVGSPIAGRPHGDLNQIVGVFINTLAMRNYPVAGKTFNEFLKEVKENALSAYEHQDYQFEELVENLDIRRDISRNPLFDVMFSMQNMEMGELSLDGLTIKPYDLENNISKFDMTLTAIEKEDTIDIGLAYATKIFKRETIERLYGHFVNILNQITENLEMKLSQIQLVTGEERQLILEDFNNTLKDYPKTKTLQQLFEEQVERNPNNIAVVFEGKQLTYGALNEKANQLARVLVEEGVKPNTVVGIMVDRSLEMMIGIMGILKAGGAYLPIEPDYIEERINYMLEDSGASLLLLQSGLQERVSFKGRILQLDNQELYKGDKSNLNIGDSSDLAYVIYTSGSTGKPKGVMIQHSSVANLTRALDDLIFSLYEDHRRVALVSPYVFDASVKTIFSALTLGHQLYIVPQDTRMDGLGLLKYYNANGIEISDGTPIHIRMLAALNNRSISVKHFIVGGEALLKADIEELFKTYQDTSIKITNVYGPTECCVDATSYLVTSENKYENIPIGKPINNVQIYVLDEALQVQPIGVIGELFISGAGVSRGYLNKPDLTAEKFIDHPFRAGEKMYRTGDLVRWLPDGNIEFMGRTDHQVKIRGYRIELGEIESTLLTMEEVKEVAVMARNDQGGTPYLCGYVAVENEETIQVSEIKEYLGKKLPEYMIPRHMMILDKIPLTTNGKVDRKALPVPEEDTVATEFVAASNETEKAMVEIWQSILNKEIIGVNDNFFDLGGHSLKATVMVAKILKTFNVELSLRQIFGNPTIKGISEMIMEADQTSYSHIEAVEEKEYYPTSSAQRRLYTLQQFESDSLGYNMPGAVMLEGSLDVEKVEESFKTLIQRHEALRTSFKMVEEEPVQYIHPEVEFKMQYMEASESQLEDKVKNFIEPFNLSEAPLLRVSIVKILDENEKDQQLQPKAEKHLLIFDMHHIISDGGSMEILIKEFAEIYQGGQLEPLRIQYKDYSQWQKDIISSGKIDEQKEYWLQQLAGEIPVLNLMGDYPRPALQSFEGDRLKYRVEESITNQLRELCKETGATMYMVLLSAFNVLLSKYTGQEDIIIGSTIAGRPHMDLSNIMGMFVNTLAMRNEPAGEKTFKDFLEEVKKNALGAYENQEYQFEDLVENLIVRRDMSRNPLFDVMFTMQTKDGEGLSLEGLEIKPFELKSNISKFDITMSGVEKEDHIEITLEYATKIFKKATIQNLYRHLENILHQIMKNPELKLSQIQLVTSEERHQIIENFNDTKTDYPSNKTIQQLFEEEVEKEPNKTAVVYNNKTLTYGELNEKSNQLARVLIEDGVKPDTMVGIMVEHSLEMVIGILAILKAGGAYLPIDPNYPIERINQMLEDSQCRLILTQGYQRDHGSLQGKSVILIDNQDLYRGDTSNIHSINRSTDLAYVIYTSGSTGRPKGAMIEHRSVVRLVKNTNYIEFKETDRILQTGSIVFDAMTFELWGALLNGLELYLVDREVILNADKLQKVIKDNNITILWLTVSLFNQLVQQSVEMFAPLRYLLVGGDALTPKFINLVRNKYPHINMINGYGPTENTTFSNCFRIDGEYTNNIPIGGPIANSTAYVVDKYNNLQPIGVAGELCLGGDGLARGYLNRPELTAEKFVDNPFVAGEKMYRTGDMVRWLPNGTIEFLGRIDHQVKIRGFRIELGEIENKLSSHPMIQEVVVLARENNEGSKYLCGYITATEEIDLKEIKDNLAKELPEYMVPPYIIQLEKMPLTANGKVDRRALPEPDGSVSSVEEYEAPRNKVEETLVEIWQEILVVDGIGINHNFFELGGHSIKAAAMMAKIHKALNVEVSLKDIFSNPTIKEIVGLIQSAEANIYSAIKAVEKKEYYAISPAQKRLYTLQQFDKTSKGYNIPGAIMLEGRLDQERLAEVFNQLIQRHEALRTSFKMIDEEPVQIIHEEVDFAIQYMEAREEELNCILKNFVKAFDLCNAPLLRVGLVKITNDNQGEEEKHLMIFDIHHIIADGTSMGILTKDFTDLYGEKQLEPLKIQYKDYSQWQQELITSGKIEEQKRYWLQQFEGEVPVLNLIGDYPRPAVQSFEGDYLGYKMDEDLTNRLKKICKATGTTLYMLLLSAYNVLLSKYSGQEDIVVGSPIAARPHGDLEDIMGMFVNTLAMRNYPKGEKTFREFLEEVKTNALAAYENQDYQFEELVENLNLRRDMSRNPLFDVMFATQNMEMGEVALADLTIKSYPLEHNTSKFDISMFTTEVGNQLQIDMEYSTKIFKKETIEGFYQHFVQILQQISKDADALETRLEDINLLTEEEGKILKEFNHTKAEYPRHKTIHQLLEEQAERTPEATAVLFQDERLTYRELNERANQLARVLRNKGVTPNTTVAIMTERSIEMIVGVVAILKSGAGYLPIDVQYPTERIEYMLQDTKLLLTQKHLMEKVTFDGEMMDIESEELYKGDDTNLTHINNPDDLLYILYTSGSTGMPKGVMLEHRNLVNLIHHQYNNLDIDFSSKVLQYTTICFDVSFQEIFSTLLRGGALHLITSEIQKNPKALFEFIDEKGVEVVFLPTSYLKFVLSQEDYIKRMPSCIKDIITAGEQLVVTEEFRKYLQDNKVNLHNHYGPTEAHVVTTFEMSHDSEIPKIPPIGKPISNTKIYIVDQAGREVPVGIPGELLIAGDCVGRGYLNNPELTAEKFIENPFVAEERMYRTGDLARWLSNGRIEFLGRIDHQVKIRGYRIEIGEVENQLLSIDGVKEGVVLVKEDNSGAKYLSAYVVTEGELTASGIRSKMAKVLPDYMIPSYITLLEEIPLTTNGKVDRRALPEEEGGLATGVEYEAPTNELEEALVEIWKEVLAVETIGINHDFFELGGHSLKATVMMAKIHKVLNVEIPLKEIFKAPTIKDIAELIKSTEKTTFSAIKPVEEQEYYPTSPAQKRLYTLQQFDKESKGYNMPAALILEGRLDVERVEETFRRLIERHESLRTSFKIIDEEPVQYIHREVDFKMEHMEAQEDELTDTINHFVKAFDLSKAPLMRIGLVKVADEKHLLIFDMHHIISDGTSLGILTKEFTEIYGEKNLEPLGIQYKDYSQWQRDLITSGKIEEQKQYWLQQFEGEIPVLNLIGDYQRPALQSFEGDRLSFVMEEGLTDDLNRICRETGTTMYMLLLSAFNVLLSKYSGQEDIIVGSPIAGRPHSDLKDIMGMFVNTLAIRNYPKGEKSFKDFLQEVKENALGAYEHQDYQFEELVENLNLRRDMSRNPLFDVMLATQNMDMEEVEAGDLTIKPFDVKSGVSKFDLTMFTAEVENKLLIDLQYSTKIFKEETIIRLYKHFERIIKQISDRSKGINGIDMKISDISLVTEEEGLILKEFNNTTAEYPTSATIHRLFEEQAAKTPDRVAVVFKDEEISYGELNERANQLARILRNKGVTPNTTVAIMTERSIEMIVGIVAILKSGAGYLPVDVQYPKDRVEYMLQDTNLLLTQKHLMEKADFGGEMLDIESDELYQGEVTNLAHINKPEDLLYILYTSGSTGRPKGVMLEHRNLVNLIQHEYNKLDIDFSGKVLQYTTVCFDVSFQEIFSTLLKGGALHLITSEVQKNPKELFEFIGEKGVEVVFLPTSYLKFVLSQGDYIKMMPSCIKDIITAGEQLVVTEEFRKYLQVNRVNLHNHYGPTEAHVVTTFEMNYDTEIPKIPPIGKPISNTKIYIVDSAGREVPVGIPGELLIAGDCVGRGYLNNPELTAEKFVENPFVTGERMYRTGDLARWMPNGNIEFLGRIDHQVKIRGYRIEIGEIENQLLSIEGIKETVVLVKEDKGGAKYLSAYVATIIDLSVSDIRAKLAETLPEYMIPAYITLMEALPLTTNGKVDRRALPEEEGSIGGGVEYEAPRNEIEEKLIGIWEEILGIKGIGINHNFFELGGHSLKATVMMAKIHKVFNVEILLKDIFKAPTIKAIGELIKTSEENIFSAIKVVEEQEYYPTSAAQKRLYTLQQFDKASIGYNMPAALFLEGNLEVSKVEETFGILTERHEALKTSFRMVEEEPVQFIQQEVNFKLQCMEAKEGELENIVKGFIKPFDLAVAPLMRVALVKVLGEDNQELEKHLLIFDMHHIISDGTTLGILTKEFSEIYGGKTLEPLRIQYKDYSQWQKDLITSGKIEEQRNYWLQQFEGEIPVLNLVGDYQRPALQTFEGDHITFELEEELTNDIRKTCRETGATMYMVLLAAFNILLSKYSNQEDIVVGSPIAGRPHTDLKDIMGMFVNTLAMRNYPKGDLSFKDFLQEVKVKALGAYENQDYQFEELVENLNIRRDMSRNPLFDVMLVTLNMEMKELEAGELLIKPFKFKNTTSKFDITLFTYETETQLQFNLEYSTRIFKRETMERFHGHFKRILKEISQGLKGVDVKIREISLVTEEENLLLKEFNHTKADYRRGITIHQLFEEQVERTPDHVALVLKEQSLTYRELNEKANQLARVLREKGVVANTTVGLMAERSLEMIIGVIGILKAGAAYLPIDVQYPKERIDYMLQDTKILLTQQHLMEKSDFEGEKIDLGSEALYRGEGTNLPNINREEDLLYILYTSGSTGKPKGVMLEHRNLVNLIHFEYDKTDIDFSGKVLQYTTICFDVSFQEIFSTLLKGGALHLISVEEQKNPKALFEFIGEKGIEVVFLPTSFLKFVLSQEDYLRGMPSCIKEIITAGEQLVVTDEFRKYLKENKVNLHNHYGPTEAHAVTTYTMNYDGEIPKVPSIGKPISNTKIYIVDPEGRETPVGIPGELLIGGIGVGRGYLNNPELTAEKFIENPFVAGERMYRTGDLARWKTDGTIEFLGRIDHQVKIRGYRIEIGEIENQLLSIEGIKEAVILVKEDKGGAKYLSAYVVTGKGLDKELTVSEIRSKMAENLPEYMIPTYITLLEALPLTTNGKVDRRALPEESSELGAGVEYEAPRNDIEEKLVAIWEEILGIQGVRINHNFFELGGHSLKATVMMAKIHKAFNVEVLLKDIFKAPTIKAIGGLINTTEESIFSAIKPVEEMEYYPTSAAQKRLFTLQQFDKESLGYNMPAAMVLEGRLELERVEGTFKRLIERHEALRTSFQMMGEEPVQYIHKETSFKLQYMEAGEEELGKVVQNFVKAFDLSQAPLMRVGFVKVMKDNHILIFDMHHIISDGTSIGIITKEFAELYGDKHLAPLRIQYKDYSHWQKELFTSGKIEEQKNYWLRQFEGEIPVLNLIGDYQRPALQTFEGNNMDYLLEEALTEDIRRICKETGATMYMVLLSAFNVLLSKYSGQEDIIVGSPIAGRPHTDLKDIMGMFANTLAMRNYPVGEKTFKEFLKEVKENALEAYENQDYQFEELVDQLNLRRDMSRNPLFDVMLVTLNMDMKPVEMGDLTIKSYPLENTTAKFDLTMFTSETDTQLRIQLEYSTKIFKQETIERLFRHFKKILKDITQASVGLDIKIADINLLTEEENHLLSQFNDTHADYEKTATIHQLFEEQVERTPDAIALVFKDEGLTYGELNRRANQLARVLREKGATPNTTVGLMTERSLEMIIGVVAILKSGAGYLPIDVQYPKDRIQYMLQDTKLLLTQDHLMEKVDFEGEMIDLAATELYQGEGSNLEHINSPADLLYILYTSGSTGKPKGVMLEHQNLVNLIRFEYAETGIDFTGKVLQYTTICFDVSFQEVFSTLLRGGALHLITSEVQKNPKALFEFIGEKGVEVIFLPTSYLKFVLSQEEYIKGLPSCIKDIITAGEQLVITDEFRRYLQENRVNLHNHYGPTEAHVVTTLKMNHNTELPKIPPIGKPISNTKIYIVDPQGRQTPVGIPGELLIAGDCVGRGYLKNPQLTAEKFIENPFVAGERMYRTGDLARWMPDGNIEFLGRIDHQVKIRGYRIEIGEIENQLLSIEGIMETVVLVREDNGGTKYLSAYVVTEGDLTGSEIRDKMAESLPEYMIPAYITLLEALPLTTNGKVDRRALPEEEGSLGAGVEFEAPRNEIEETLVAIWEEILGIKGIGINHNFFELGGHSLKATVMMAKIHKAFDVEVPLKVIFKNQTIKSLGVYIRDTDKTAYLSIAPIDEAEYYPLSSAQRRLFLQGQVNQTSTAYNMTAALILEGDLDRERLEAAINGLIERHEALRSTFTMVNGTPMQKISKDVKINIHYREAKGEELRALAEDFIKPFNLGESPLLRVSLVKCGEAEHLLLFDLHHIISDGVSMSILTRDFIYLYEGKDLPPLRIQYKDYAAWHNALLESERMKEIEGYWMNQLEIFSRTNLPIKQVMSKEQQSHVQRVLIDEELTAKINDFCQQQKITKAVLMLAIFKLLLGRSINQNNITVGLPVAGRRHADLENVMGIFLNILLSSTSIPQDGKFIDFLKDFNDQFMELQENQDYPYELLHEKASEKFQTQYKSLFSILFNYLPYQQKGDIGFKGLKSKPYQLQEPEAKYSFTLYVKEDKDRIVLEGVHDQLVDGNTIESILNSIPSTIETVIANREIAMELLVAPDEYQDVFEEEFAMAFDDNDDFI